MSKQTHTVFQVGINMYTCRYFQIHLLSDSLCMETMYSV